MMPFHLCSLFITDPIKTDKGSCLGVKKELEKSATGSLTKQMKSVENKTSARRKRLAMKVRKKREA